VPGLGLYEAVKTNTEEVELFGYRVYVLTLEGLIIAKETTGRPKDFRLLPELKALQAMKSESDKNKSS
jgi:predicted nucleotidyltransferase